MAWRHATAVLSLLLLLGACGSRSSTDADTDDDPTTDVVATTADTGRPSPAEIASDEVKGGETYQEYSERRDALGDSAGSYAGYGCTQDCSGHEAGYQWAEEHEISDPEECGGNSWSFVEGCRSYAEGQQQDSEPNDPR